jgi:hypothetical protein
VKLSALSSGARNLTVGILMCLIVKEVKKAASIILPDHCYKFLDIAS